MEVNTAFADGIVRRIPSPGGMKFDSRRRQWMPNENFDEKPLRAMITRHGGEPE